MSDILEIIGEGGGKGGGGGSAVEAPNTLTSRAIVKVIEVLSEGEIVGIAGGAKGIYLNDTPLQNSDESYNFARAAWDYRVGLPSQDHMAGFPSVEAEIVIGTVVTYASPVTRSTTSATVDAVKVTISLPQGLAEQDMSNGNINGTSVQFAIDRKLTSSGSWVQVNTYTIEGKTTTSTEKQYRIERPTGSGTFDIRVRRLTADSASSALRNQIALARVTEVQDIKLPYNDTAYVGLAIDAESVGNQIPNRAFLVKGIKVQVPSNYNPDTRVYTGLWNGTFQTAWTDNPAWVLYDLITNARYGLGEFITASQVDKFSFYDAAVYNDALVNNGRGGTEPRFTFNAVIGAREEAYRLLTAVAGAMRATLLYANGQVKLLQDRPADPVKLVNKSNVINGIFDYRSTGLFERHTAFNITWNDRGDRHLQRVTTVDLSNIGSIASTYTSMLTAAQNKYGYSSADISAFGATTEGQAIRHALWALDTELNQTEVVQFKMSLNGFDLFPGDIVKLFDEDYVGARGAGRVLSVAGTTVTLDRPITLTAGGKIDVVLADGKTIEQRNIVGTSGTTSVITVSSAFSQAVLPNAEYIATLIAAPRQFKILSLKQEDANIVGVEAVYHDPNKYSRIESNISAPTPVFSTVRPSMTNAPTALTFREIQVNNASEGTGGLRRSLLVSWTAPTIGEVQKYVVRYRLGKGEWTKVEPDATVFEISPAFAGTYEVDVSAQSTSQIVGPTVSGSYTIQTTGGGASTLNAPTSLTINGGGTSFGGLDINFQFTNPSSNNTVLTSVLRDFEVRFIETTGSTTVRTVYVPAVSAGSTQTASYTYAMNTADGGPRRSIQVQVRCRDASNNLSDPITATFTNSAPAVPSSIAVVGALGSNKITFTLPTDPDFKGILVWRSTTNSFTPSSGNLVYDGSDNYVSDNALAANTTYYYRVAAYDVFAKDLAGTGLNISAQYTATTVSNGGIPSGASNPGSGAQGDLFFNTTDNKLYRYTGSAWTSAVPAVDVSGTLSSSQIASVTAAQITGAIQDSQLAAIGAAKVTGTLVNSQIADLAASKVTGTLTNTQIADLAATKITGTLVNAQIADLAASKVTGTLTNAQIADLAATKVTGQIVGTQITDGAITTVKIGANQVTAGKIAVGTITANEIASNTITAGNIAANAITTSKLLVTGRGQAVNDDPFFNDATAWPNSGNITFTTITDGTAGLGVARSGTTNSTIASKHFAFDPLKTYRIRGKCRSVGANGVIYLTVILLDTAGANISRDGTFWFYPVSGATASGSWTEYTGTFGAGQGGNVFPSNARQMAAAFILNYGGSAGYHEVQDLRIEEMTRADLIVDGQITAAKIVANTITSVQIASNTITAGNILAGTITANEIAGSTITGAKIAGGTITGTQIAGSTITGSNIAGATITAGNLVSGTITAGYLAANAVTAGNIAAGAVTTDKLVVTGRGKALNDDPACTDSTAWSVGAGAIAFQTDTSAPIGSKSIRCTNGTQVISKLFPVEAGRTYKIALWAKQVSGGGGLFIRLYTYSGTGANVSYYVTGLTPVTSTFENLTVPGSWTKYVGFITPAATSVTGAVFLHVNWNTTGVTDITDIRCEEYIGADLIVDGTIIGTKIAASTITGSNIAGNTITAGNILANTITAGQIASSTITGDRIAGTTITAANIVGNTITGDKIAAGTVTATNIDTRNLTIKDGAGTVVFSAGVPLAATYADAALKNSTITISSTGAISGIGTGAGVSVANNRDSVITAPEGGLYVSGASSATGSLKIRLPVWFTDSMLRFTVEIYEYSTGYMATLEVGGYNYNSGTFWNNVSARVLGGSNVEYPVYFGHDGTKSCVWIDVPSATWSYPQVRVRDVFIGYNNVARDTWATGWQVSFDTAFTLVNGTGTNQYTAVVTDTFPGADWSKTARRPANVAALAGSEPIQNSQIAVSGGTITGIGTGNGTAVANSSITVSGGTITGIGTGNGTAVANNQISIASNGTLSGAGGGTVTITGLGYNGDLNASSDLVLTGASNVTIAGNRITKINSSSWDGGAYSRDGYIGGAYASCVFGNGGGMMMGLNTDPAADASYTSIDFAIYWVGDGRVQIYESGVNKGEPITSGATTDVFTVVYDGRSVFYLRNGSVIYQRGVTVSSPLYFDCSLASNTGFMTNCRFGPVTTNASTNLVDSRTWVLGSFGTQPGFNENSCSSTGYNVIENGPLPNGEQGTVWTAKSGTAAGDSSEGGWNGASVPIDNTKMYRFSVWVRFEGNTSGSVYLGCGASTVNDLAGGANGNPYFYTHSRAALPTSKWMLIVGYVYPASYGGSTSSGGVYRADTGALLSNTTSFRWTSAAVTTWLRAYQYYTNTGSGDAYTVFWNPRLDVCDGTEPSVSSMLAMGATSGRNPITSGTASTYIASAAINLAQINTASIGSLSAITATVGLLRTATSGARTEIADNVIRVYDSSNVLRVKIGNLA